MPRITFLVGTVLFATACLAEDVGTLSGYSTWARLAYGLSAAMIVVGAAAAERERPIRVPSLLSMLGAASYSVYLFQFVFIGLAWQALLHAGLDRSCPAVIAFMLLAVAGIGGGVAMSQKVELPVMRLVRGERLATAGRPATVR